MEDECTLKIAAMALAALLLVSVSRVAAAKTADPPFATGVSTTGATIGPDGALYAGVSGNGDQEIVLPPDIAAAFGIEKAYFGLNSSVMRIDPSTGAVTTLRDGTAVGVRDTRAVNRQAPDLPTSPS